MTNTKKRSVVMLLALFACAVCVLVSLTFTSSGAVAYAATTPRYSMQFNYSIRTTNGSSYSYTNGTGYSVNVQTSQYGSSPASLYIYGSGYSSTGTFPIGSSINSSTVNLGISSNLNMGSITVKNSSGTQVGSGKKTLTLTGLSDGRYDVTLYFGGGAWATSARSGIGISVSGTTSFVVDSTAPSVYGASTSTTGKYTNSAFTVSANDNIGLENLYMRSPTDATYYAVGSSKTVAAGSANGLYRFYAKDKAGNSSAIHYVYYDNTAPIGVIKNSSGTTLTGSCTNVAFNYTATDTGGISYLQFRTPTLTSWTTNTSGTSITTSSTNGAYTFRAVDKSGNISAAKTITLDTVKPTGTIYGGTSAVASGGRTNASYIKFVGADNLTGVSKMYVKVPNSSSYANYASGTQYAVDGTYSFYCTDFAGNVSATYSVTLDKTAPTLTCAKTAFYSTYEYGFSVSASDTASSVKLYYKTPSATSYTLASGTSYSVTDAMENGKYYFYAVDTAGNQSSTVWINLNIEYPEAQQIKSPTDNSVCYTWNGTETTAKLNGSTYAKGTWVKAEGSYTLVLTNSYGRSTTYTFSVGHYYLLKQTVAATCSSQGYQVYACSHCSSSYKTNYTAALGHNYSKTTTAPTCLEKGFTVYKCTRCSHAYTADYTAALGHSYVEETITPTCTEAGCVKHTCSRCSESYETDATIALGHKFVETEVIATCTENGCIKHTCAVCAFEYKTNVVEATGHSYVTEVTMTATCTEKGERCHICEKCGESYTNEIPAIGHTYEITEVTTEDGKTVRQYTCTTCGDRYIQNMGDQYEHVSSYVEHLFELYAPYMWWVLLATTGVWSIAIGIAIIVARKNDDKEKAKKMLVNYVIGLVIIAAIVVACPYLIKGIAALVT